MSRTKYDHTALALKDPNQEAALLWEAICDHSKVERFHLNIVQHEKSVLFGYADVTLAIRTVTGVVCPVKLRGIVVKSLKGKAHIDMPADNAEGSKEFYDIFMPRSAALRTVLTMLIFQDPEVIAAIAEAAGQPRETSTERPDETGEERPTLRAGNPFAPKAA